MSRASLGTPCPPAHALSNLPVPASGRRLSSTTSIEGGQDDTVDLDYTRAIQVEFKNAKPRRRSTFYPKAKKEAAVTIFEDVLEDEELVVENKPEIGGSTLLGKRAQKPPGRALPKTEELPFVEEQEVAQSNSHARRKSSVAFQRSVAEDERDERVKQSEKIHEPAEEVKAKGGLKKEPRRRTIFVPSDDTTMLTIHPGAQATDRLNDTFQLPDFDLRPPPAPRELKPAEEVKPRQPAKRPRMSLAAAPKRVPLQQVGAQEANVPITDIAGQNGGKENLPPNSRISPRSGEALKDRGHADKGAEKPIAGSSLFAPTAASKARRSIVPRDAVPFTKPAVNTLRPQPPKAGPLLNDAGRGATTQVKPKRVSLMLPEGSTHRKSPESDQASNEHKKRVEAQRPKPVGRKIARLSQYPVLSEDLAQPELYEDSWLGHQEVALTELINQIFSRSEPVKEDWQRPKHSLRERLITIYHTPNVTTLHRRLQASLQYGALSRPKDADRAPDPAHDIGLRKRFLGLWLESYDQESLRAAAEVVFGHQLPKKPLSSSAGNEGILDPHKGRRTLIGFLETFLVEVEDVEQPDVERGDDPNGRWRKMVSRSLMLIWLLDQAKTQQIVPNCLFKPSSPRKTSVSMLHSVASMLIPSIGDVTRALRHLDYDVCHAQDPLDEVHYRIDNIAVDLRDGIVLARLVELLLFSSANSHLANATGDATVTVQMPDMTILESALYENDGSRCPRILSKHLKMPCLGRAQKVYNVEIAISALHNHGKIGDNMFDITADNIVDGHREKTLGLLWSLVSSHGLEQLVDFAELSADIRRSLTNAMDVDSLPADCSSLSQMQQESLLKKWASVYCAKRGVRISNLTTSFADGNAYAAISDAFAAYTHSGPAQQHSSPLTNVRLEAQLRSLGCSSAFIKQLTSNAGTIPSRKTTISSLAFLASRLLPLARRHNAAVVIQRNFRLRRSKVIASQRIALMRLAHACATVAQTQNRLVTAATVLQRAWRRVLDARIEGLNNSAETFQSLARSWLVRRKLSRSQNGAMSEGQSLRMMRGW